MAKKTTGRVTASTAQDRRRWRSRLAYPNQRAVVGYVSNGGVKTKFMESLFESERFDRELSWGRFQTPWRIAATTSANINRARNSVVRDFLALDGSPPWLWMVDTDMAWEPTAFETLLMHAEPGRIVGGLCFAYGTKQTIRPTIFQYDDIGRMVGPWELDPTWVLPDNTMLQVAGTGAAFLVVHRDALLAMATAMNEIGPTGNPWFREVERMIPTEGSADLTAHWVSEDLFFCQVAGQAGVEVFVHTGVKVRHRKEVWLDEPLYRSDYSAMSW